MKSVLLERLSKEKPAHEVDEIGEALRRGYSMKQIIRAIKPEANPKEPRQGKIFYAGHRGTFEVPYTYENYLLLCRIMFE